MGSDEGWSFMEIDSTAAVQNPQGKPPGLRPKPASQLLPCTGARRLPGQLGTTDWPQMLLTVAHGALCGNAAVSLSETL